MNNWRNNPADGNGNGEPKPTTRTNQQQSSAEISPDELIQFARDHFANEFPNPTGRDCPNGATLNSLARSGRLPDDQLRAHLFGCSNCFQEYRQALAERRQPLAAIPESSWPETLRAKIETAADWFRPKLVWAGAATALLLGFAIWTVWRAHPGASTPDAAPQILQAQSPSPAPAQPNPIPLEQVARVAEPPAPQPSLSARRPKVAFAIEATVNIDLNEFIAMRNLETANQVTRKIIQLQAVQTRIKLNLPEGSLAGKYQVSLLDEFDSPLVTKTVTSCKGRQLVSVLDLRRIPTGSYQLSLKHKTEWAESYPAFVAKPKHSKKH